MIQKVETYSDFRYAKNQISSHLEKGWLVHTCISGSCSKPDFGILVIYEKEENKQGDKKI